MRIVYALGLAAQLLPAVPAAAAEPVVFPPVPGKVTRSEAPTDFKPGAFVRLEKRGDTWWLVTPAGRGFYATGTNGPSFDRSDPSMADGRRFDATMRAIGFNSLAGWTSIPSWTALNDALVAEGKRPWAMFHSFETGNMRGDFDRLSSASGSTGAVPHAFPDPFDPRFAEAYRAQVHGAVASVKGKPWFVAWFADNEVRHTELYRKVWSKNCAVALQKFLEGRYGTIAALNKSWGSQYASFDDLINARPDPSVREGPMYDDFRMFEREIVKKYVAVTLGVIKSEDPDHLVFSNRFMRGDQTAWMDLLDLYTPYDGIAVNIYPANKSAGLGDPEQNFLRSVHEKTGGKPMIIGEWSVPALDSHLYDNPAKLDWSFPQTVPTQTDRARQAACITVDFHNLPFLVGAHWYTWRDFDSEVRQANRGLVKASGEPWQELIDALTAAHLNLRGRLPWE